MRFERSKIGGLAKWPHLWVTTAALLCALAAPGLAHATGTSLFPNIVPVTPTDLHFDTVVVADGSTHNVVRFTQMTKNIGEGPFEIRGNPAGGGQVYQRLYSSDGTFTDFPVQSDFIYHPTHHHFHFADYAYYEMWTKASWDAYVASGYIGPQQPLGIGSKVSFCVMDTKRDGTIPGVPAAPVYTTCDQNSQGLSVGWGDTYNSNVDGQWVDVGPVVAGQPALPDGQYVVRAIVDPKNLIFESPSMLDASRESTVANQATALFTVDNTPPPDPCQFATTNKIVCENSKAGNPASEWSIGTTGDTSIAGFPTEQSVNPGQRMSFKIKTDAAGYTVKIYRLGWYQGNGARLVAIVNPSAALPQLQPPCLTQPSVGLVDCGNWGVSAYWDVPAEAVSGVYVANLIRNDTGGVSQIPFVIRNDASHSDIVFQTDDADWQAYNTWGGSASYYRPDTATRARKISYNRPLDTRIDSPLSYLFSGEYPMIRFLERNGYDISYFSDVDSSRLGSELLNHKTFLVSGHSEYWSGESRAALTAARDAGVNIAMFSGNTMFWKTRWENSIDGSNTPYRTMVCYKESLDNARTDPSGAWTGEWRDMRYTNAASNTPENALTGTLFTTNAYAESSIVVDPSFGRLRFWRDTTIGIASGPVSLPTGVLGYEWDSNIDNGWQPAGLFNLSSTTESVTDRYDVNGFDIGPGIATHNMTQYRATSGALVFSAGTIQWAWGLDMNHDVKSATPPRPTSSEMQQATVNLLADMNVQPQSLMASLAPETASTDRTAPTSTITTPSGNRNVPQSSTLTISGTAADTGEGIVAGVEISTDDGVTWHPTTGASGPTMTWTYSWKPALGPTYSTRIRTRAVDDSGNLETPSAGVPVNVVTRVCPCSAFDSTAVPENVSSADTDGIEVGVKFRSDVSGYITGVRFYKGAGNGGQHIASLWTSTGTLLARAPFTGESAGGWQQVLFDAPVGITANTTYLVSYFAPQGHYAVTRPFFTKSVYWAPIRLLQDGVDGANGMYLYGSSPSFPTNTSSAGNYWVDPVFDTVIQADTTPPTVTSSNPQPGQTLVDARIAPTVSFSEAVQASTVSSSTVKLTDPSNIVVPAVVSYSAAARALTITPNAVLRTNTVYTLTVTGGASGLKDMAGNPLTTYTLSFTTASLACPCSIWPANPTPKTPASADGGSVELGVKFRSDVAGYVTGLRFYKGAGNGGTHVGTVWSSTGALLARATFSGESASGWQQVTFANPVQVTADTTYIASYFAPQGHYAIDRPFFTAQVAASPLRALADGFDGGNGLYLYGSVPSFPNKTSGSANYWVDVVFTTVAPADTTPPSVTGVSPSDGATGVDPGTNAVSASFSEGMQPSTISASTFTLTAGGSTVPASVAYNTATRTSTITPNAPLAWGTQYTAKLLSGPSGVKDMAGNPIVADYIFRFTTQACPCSVFKPTLVPDQTASADPNSVEVGMRFRSSMAGYITGVKFYKGTGNSGVHVGSLWTTTGSLLARATFTGESASGWQTVLFDVPVAISANTTYLASYFAPNGRYALTRPGLATAVVNAPLTGLADGTDGANGVYLYTGSPTFPTQTSGSGNYWVDAVFNTSAPADTTPPVIVSTLPVAGSTSADPSSALKVSFSESLMATSVNAANVSLTGPGGAVAASIAYDSAARTVVVTPASALAFSTPYTLTIRGGSGSVADLAGNVLAATTTVSFATASLACPCSIWPSNAVPGTASAADTSAVELGMRFRSDVSGWVTGVRFYKGPSNTGTHVGTLWSSTGTQLAQATFINESATGWQTVSFSTPVQINANTTYVVGYFAPAGGYSVDRTFFTSNIASPPLRALGDGVDGANGAYKYSSAPAFPSGAAGGSNYWVDVVFASTQPPPLADTTPPTIVSRSPVAGATGVDVATPVAVGFDEPLKASSVTATSVTLTGPGGTAVPAAVTYDSTSQSVKLVASVYFAYATTYTVTIAGGAGGVADAVGNTNPANQTWTFSTMSVNCPCSVWGATAAPLNPSAADTGSVNVGMKFRSDVAGSITAIRFYKGPANTGTHVGSLWTATGTLLSQVTFTGESASGWQQANLMAPVAISANTTYVVSYLAPAGGYASDRPFFTSLINAPPLRALADGFDGANGLYLYGSSALFPTNAAGAANYWVDVVFVSP